MVAAEETEQKVGFPITISVGIAYSIGRELMFPDLFVTADRALYEAKEKEGNTISVKEMNQQEREAPVIAAVDLNEQELKTVRTQCGRMYEVIATDSGLDTRRLLERRKQKVQMVLMSAHQSSFRRAEALSSIHQIRSIHKVPVILIVGEGDESSDLCSIADAVLKSPLSPSDVEAAVSRAHEMAIAMHE